MEMKHFVRHLTMAAMLAGIAVPDAASAQKAGGILHIPSSNTPASMSIHEESTRFAVTPVMGVFNNLVLFDQHVAQNSFSSIVPELATKWSWSEDGKVLSFELRHGVKWH